MTRGISFLRMFVSSYGEPFEDACKDVFNTIGDAIKEWTSKTGIGQGDRSEKKWWIYQWL
jgi:hypothetical protein